jgi:formamidopyrimidine-DNA glycosylase
MPELPEVETIVRGLRKKIIGRKIKSVWFDSPSQISLQ